MFQLDIIISFIAMNKANMLIINHRLKIYSIFLLRMSNSI